MVNARDGLNQTLDPAQARAMIDWLIAAGADEALSESPIDRFAVAAEPVVAVPAATPAPARSTPAPIARPELPRSTPPARCSRGAWR